MSTARDIDESEVARGLDLIYDAAVAPAQWPAVLTMLGCLFESHFVDLFARTDDWCQYDGLAIGLTAADYHDEFLGVWSNRNVWAKTKPVRIAGEVLPTWQMVERRDLMRSAIYNEYLRPRDLHEGLRLALWAKEGWIQDISLLRPFARGPFTTGEIALGQSLLPHLQRAASVSRRVQGALDMAGIVQSEQPAFLLDQTGRLLRSSPAGDRLLAAGAPFTLASGVLVATPDAMVSCLAQAIAAASGIHRLLRGGTSMVLQDPRGSAHQVSVLPVKEDAEWSMPGPRSVLVVVTGVALAYESRIEGMMARYGLTHAEAGLAGALLSGQSMQEIASQSGRSIHTTRSHLARIMEKTGTRRQGQLVRVLMQGETNIAEPTPPWGA